MIVDAIQIAVNGNADNDTIKNIKVKMVEGRASIDYYS
jgi:hypothetical protein